MKINELIQKMNDMQEHKNQQQQHIDIAINKFVDGLVNYFSEIDIKKPQDFIAKEAKLRFDSIYNDIMDKREKDILFENIRLQTRLNSILEEKLKLQEELTKKEKELSQAIVRFNIIQSMYLPISSIKQLRKNKHYNDNYIFRLIVEKMVDYIFDGSFDMTNPRCKISFNEEDLSAMKRYANKIFDSNSQFLDSWFSTRIEKITGLDIKYEKIKQGRFVIGVCIDILNPFYADTNKICYDIHAL